MRQSLGSSLGSGAMRHIILRGLGGCALLLLAGLLAFAASDHPHGTLLGYLMFAGSIVTFPVVVVWFRRSARSLTMVSLAAACLVGSIAISFVAIAVTDGLLPAAVLTFAALTLGYGLISVPLCAVGLGLIWSSFEAVRARHADPGGAAT